MDFEKEPKKSPEKYEMEYKKCKECGAKFPENEADQHNKKTKHVDFKSTGMKEYTPTVKEAQDKGLVIFVENKSLEEERGANIDTHFKHVSCDAFLECDDREKDIKKNRSIRAHCPRCDQRFLFEVNL